MTAKSLDHNAGPETGAEEIDNFDVDSWEELCEAEDFQPLPATTRLYVISEEMATKLTDSEQVVRGSAGMTVWS